jgi:hypothetical protein
MILRLLSISFLASLLIACNGSSGDNGDNPFGGDDTPSAPVVALQLSVLDSNCQAVAINSFTTDQTVCLQATLTQNGNAFTNQTIAFSSGIGILDVATRITNAQGIAQVTLTSDGATLGASTVTANFDTLQVSENIEFTASDIAPTPDPTLTLQMLDQAGNPVLRFPADQQVRLLATFIGADSTPVANEIVQFSVTRGQLSITDALTNDNGQAEVQLTGIATDLGAGIANASVSDDTAGLLNDTLNFEVQSVDVVEEDVVRIGYFDGETFIEGALGVNGLSANETVSISAGATLGLLVGLADASGAPILSTTPISFSSACATDGRATLDATVSTVNGRASSTYEDINCAGGNGNDDVVTASVLVNNTPLSVSRSIALLPETIGSIEFVSATPDSIVLQGTGGQGSETVSTITFQVNGALGNPLAQKEVSFSLSSSIGGLELSPVVGLTNSQGQVSTRVTAGTVPTSVRVTASIEGDNSEVITTQSDLLTVNTGLPDQNSFSLSASNVSPEANSIDGQTVTITAFLADTFNNPVPDGTAVSFTTEGGQIQPSCTTVNGSCSVEWTSAEPRVADHRITILATAIGHETLIDGNGNNLYDDADGGALSLGVDSGLDVATAPSSGFVDVSEAWLDANENRVYDSNENFLDFDSSGDFTAANQLFDGPQCDSSSCGAEGLHVRRALIMIMSSSNLLLSFSENGTELANNSGGASSSPVLSIPRGESRILEFGFSDNANQPVPGGSELQISTNNGELAGQTSGTIRQSTRAGTSFVEVSLTNNLAPDDSAIDSTVTAVITTPSGVQNALTIIVTLE